MEIDLDRFKVKKPWLDLGFWIALAHTAVGVAVIVNNTFGNGSISVAEAIIAVALNLPIVQWLRSNGYIRANGVQAAGQAMAAMAPELVRAELVYGTSQEAQSNPPVETPDIVRLAEDEPLGDNEAMEDYS